VFAQNAGEVSYVSQAELDTLTPSLETLTWAEPALHIPAVCVDDVLQRCFFMTLMGEELKGSMQYLLSPALAFEFGKIYTSGGRELTDGRFLL